MGRDPISVKRFSDVQILLGLNPSLADVISSKVVQIKRMLHYSVRCKNDFGSDGVGKSGGIGTIVVRHFYISLICGGLVDRGCRSAIGENARWPSATKI